MKTMGIPGIVGAVRYRTEPAGHDSLAVTVDLPHGPIRSGLMLMNGGGVPNRIDIVSGEIRVKARTARAAIELFALAVHDGMGTT